MNKTIIYSSALLYRTSFCHVFTRTVLTQIVRKTNFFPPLRRSDYYYFLLVKTQVKKHALTKYNYHIS